MRRHLDFCYENDVSLGFYLVFVCGAQGCVWVLASKIDTPLWRLAVFVVKFIIYRNIQERWCYYCPFTLIMW